MGNVDITYKTNSKGHGPSSLSDNEGPKPSKTQIDGGERQLPNLFLARNGVSMSIKYPYLPRSPLVLTR